MVSSSQTPTDLSEGRPSDKSLGAFVKELAATLQELNTSVLLMTRYIVDGVLTNDLASAIDAAAARQSDPTPADLDAFVVVPETAPSGATASSATASGSTSVVVMHQHVPTWYAVVVGREPGVFEESGIQISANIERIPGGRAIKFKTEAEAKEEFDKRLRAGLIKQVEFHISEKVVSYDEYYRTQQ